MPDMDGFAVAEKIRENSHLAGADHHDAHLGLSFRRQRAMPQTWNRIATLVKPIQQSEWLDAILNARFVRRPEVHSAAVASAAEVPVDSQTHSRGAAAAFLARQRR